MKKLIVKNKQGVQTHGADSGQFQSEAEFDAWVENCKSKELWGKNAAPESVDEFGNVIPAQEQEYEVEIVDITQEVEAEKKAKADKKLAKEARKTERKAVDVAKITTVKALLPVIENLIKTVEELEERLG